MQQVFVHLQIILRYLQVNVETPCINESLSANLCAHKHVCAREIVCIRSVDCVCINFMTFFLSASSLCFSLRFNCCLHTFVHIILCVLLQFVEKNQCAFSCHLPVSFMSVIRFLLIHLY